jgi:hypothetical protein
LHPTNETFCTLMFKTGSCLIDVSKQILSPINQ